MDMPLRLIVHRGKSIFDEIIVTPDSVIKYDPFWERIQRKREAVSNNSLGKEKKREIVPLNKRGYNAYLVSVYVVTLTKSDVYRQAALKILLQFLTYKLFEEECVHIILMKLRTPRRQFLDYAWNERIVQMVVEKREADFAMSWLSTLGGAFSALGEEFEHCAEMAGKISVKQFELALRLGNPLLVARCKIYAALSLIQRGQFKTPKCIIKKMYRFAIDQKDIRLQNMCLGVWAKLKHCYKMHKQQQLIS